MIFTHGGWRSSAMLVTTLSALRPDVWPPQRDPAHQSPLMRCPMLWTPEKGEPAEPRGARGGPHRGGWDVSSRRGRGRGLASRSPPTAACCCQLADTLTVPPPVSGTCGPSAPEQAPGTKHSAHFNVTVTWCLSSHCDQPWVFSMKTFKEYVLKATCQ